MPISKKTDLRQWIWRAFVQSALIPLLLVETVLIAVYLMSNVAIRDAQVNYLRDSARTDLLTSSSLEARVINEQLTQIDSLTDSYRHLSAEALSQPGGTLPENLASAEDGVRYSSRDDGNPAVFYSNRTPAPRQDLDSVARMTRMASFMKEIKQRNPLVAAIYYNSHDSFNYIFPWFDTYSQYPHDMNIPEYNFYYLADGSHNPTRDVVWTDVYLDPAGQGWMMSAIAPVHLGEQLQGVVGLDVTVGNILKEIGHLQVPWGGYALLVSKELNIMAIPEPGEKDFGLTELTTHSYDEALRRELFKPEDFNLFKREHTTSLAARMQQNDAGMMTVTLNEKTLLMAWTTIPQTGWRLLTVAAEEDVFRNTNQLADRYREIGYLLIAGLVFFYGAFFSYMWLRSRQLTTQLRRPFAGLSRMMADIGGGFWRPQPVVSDIREIQEVSDHAAATGVQLEESEARQNAIKKRLDLVLESATESLWERDFRTGEIELRGRFARRFGVSSEKVGEAEFLSRIHPDDVAHYRVALEAVNHGGGEAGKPGLNEKYSCEYRFADADGRYTWLLSRGRIIEWDDDSGEPLLLGGTHLDIDNLKRVEADLRHAMVEALRASQTKSRFISSISHELRTPLNAILGFTQLLKIRWKRSEGAENEFINEIDKASQHLKQLVEDVLDLSRSQHGGVEIELAPVALKSLLEDCTGMMKPGILAHQLEYDVQLPDATLMVQTDARRLRQILLNLLSNALKYNRPGGKITVSTSLQKERIRILVEDTGLGLSDEQQKRLFEPFERLGRENTSIPGTGIGLALCREYATRMNTRIGVQSQTDAGSSFWIDLPLVKGVESRKPIVDASIIKRIVYVEDNPASQTLVTRALEGIARVDAVEDGAIALEMLLQAPPDMVLLDYNLPGLNGEQLLKRLRQNEATAGLPVILITALAETVGLMELECQGILSKPIDIAELRKVVSQYLAGTAAQG